MKLLKRCAVIFVALTLAITFVPLIGGSAGIGGAEPSYADDSRTPITRVDFTTDETYVDPVLGQELFYPSLYQVDPANPVYISSCDWQKWNEDTGTWEYVYSGVFTEGDWAYLMQIRIDEPDSELYYIDPTIVTTVDTYEWDNPYGFTNSTDIEGNYYSYAYMRSPTFTVDVPADMPLSVLDHYEIPVSYAGNSIEAFSINAIGGTAPYTFSKVSGPSWIQVSADGKISGIPTAVGTNDDLIVAVTDSSATPVTEKVTISVDKTYRKPDERIKISSVEYKAISMPLPKIGKEILHPVFESVDSSNPLYVNDGMGNWEKYNESKGQWENIYSGIYDEGTWRYSVQLRIDGENGRNYMIAWPMVSKVDGTIWENPYSWYLADDLSYSYMASREYVLSSDTPAYYYVVFTDGQGNAITSQGIPSGQSATEPALPSRQGYKFAGWDADFSNVTSNLTFNANWIEDKKLGSMALSAISYAYNGSTKTPGVTVKDSEGETLVKNTDYTVSYAPGRKNIGSYMVTVAGMGDYTGTLDATFKINPTKVSILTPKVGKRYVTVKWKKAAGSVKYQIAYKQKGASEYKYAYSTSTSKTIKKLKSKKYYYVKVQAYKKVGDDTYYGAWSSTKKVKIK